MRRITRKDLQRIEDRRGPARLFFVIGVDPDDEDPEREVQHMPAGQDGN